MQTLNNIPRVLQKIQDIHQSNYEQLYLQYKQKVKFFISSVNQQVCNLIDKYEQEIKILKQQNQKLKMEQIPLSPIKFKSQFKTTSPGTFDLMNTVKSKLFNPQQCKLSQVINFQKNSDNKAFPIQLISKQLQNQYEKDYAHHSVFLNKMKRKKQKQEQLRHFLQTGKKNLNNTTNRFLQVIQKQPDNTQISKKQKQNQNSDSSFDSKKNDSGSHNQSLGSLCKSLQNSYISKKVRSQKKKRNEQIKDQTKRKQQQDQQLAKMLKNKGLKSLLQRLRNNADSPSKSPQIIKMSKLMSCGSSTIQKKKQKQVAKVINIQPQRKRKNSKVLINPVPVDIVKKSQAVRKYSNGQIPINSQKKMPQSILKQSSQILGRSLSGISAINFAQQ